MKQKHYDMMVDIGKKEIADLITYTEVQAAEIAKLKGLLQRWQNIGVEFNIYPTIKQLKLDTKAVLGE